MRTIRAALALALLCVAILVLSACEFDIGSILPFKTTTEATTTAPVTTTAPDPTAPCVHEWEEQWRFDGVCGTSDGYVRKRCTLCGEREFVILPAPKHVPMNPVTENVVGATCATEGSYLTVVYCATCGGTVSSKITRTPKTMHTPLDPVTENVVSATCAAKGSYDTVVYCGVCNGTIYRWTSTVPALDHTPLDPVTENSVAATCIKDGSYDSVVYCDVCEGEISRDTVSVPTTGHSCADGACTVCHLPESTHGLVYTLNDDERSYTVTGIGDCTATELVIGIYQNKSVTAIAPSAFANCTDVTSVVIGDCVKSVGAGAFSGCSALASITLPFVGASATATGDTALLGYLFGGEAYEGGTEIRQYYSDTGYELFYIPTSLTSVTFTGTGISYGAFNNCLALKSVTLGDALTSIGEYAFAGCTGLTELTVPTGVTTIGLGAFERCESLVRISLPFAGKTDGGKKNTHFGYAFGATSYSENASRIPASLKAVVLNGTTAIGSYAFYGCNITEITIPSSVKSIGSCAFSECWSLSRVNIEDLASWCAIGFENTTANPLYYGEALYLGGEHLTEITIPSTVTSIAAYAFCGCDLTEITIPGGVKTIGAYAFYECYFLRFAIVPQSVTTMGAYAFSGCDELTVYCAAVSKPSGWSSYWVDSYARTIWGCIEGGVTADGIEWIGNRSGAIVIGYCGTAAELTVPKTIAGLVVFEISNYAFADCKMLESVTILCNVPSIGDSLFENCTSLVSVTIPSGVTSIGYGVFYGCTSLKSIVIPSSVTSIGASAFENCTSLEWIELPFVGATKDGTGSTNFGYIFGAYSYINNNSAVPTSLKTVVITGGESIAGYAFYNCDSLESITIQGSVTSIGARAFCDCDSLESVVIPSSVAIVGDYAFCYCSKLTIYCEAASQPSGWSNSWNAWVHSVQWGYSAD